MKQTEQKRYPIKFTNMTLVVIIIALVLCAACFALSTWRFVGFLQSGDLSSVYEWIEYAILFLASTLFALFLSAMLVRSQYLITDRQIILQLGILQSKYDIQKICSVHLFKGSNKLALYFDNYHNQFATITVNDSWFDDFIKTLLSKKPGIEFSFSTAEEESENKRK